MFFGLDWTPSLLLFKFRWDRIYYYICGCGGGSQYHSEACNVNWIMRSVGSCIERVTLPERIYRVLLSLLSISGVVSSPYNLQPSAILWPGWNAELCRTRHTIIAFQRNTPPLLVFILFSSCVVDNIPMTKQRASLTDRKWFTMMKQWAPAVI